MDHFTHDGAVTIVLSIEVLRLVAHSVSCVAHNRDLNLGIIGFLFQIALFVRVHCDLHAGRQGRELLIGTYISVLKFWAHWVHVEEWVLPMFHVSHGLPIVRLMSLVTNCWQIQVCALLLNLDSLEPIVTNKFQSQITLANKRERFDSLTQHRGSWKHQPCP